MSITGKLLINGEWVTGQSGTYQAVNPASGAKLEPVLSKASSAQVDAAVAAAAACAAEFRRCSLAKRAEFLRACATEIMALGDELVQRAIAETGLPQGAYRRGAWSDLLPAEYVRRCRRSRRFS